MGQLAASIPASCLYPEEAEQELAVNRIRFFPRQGHAARMQGKRFVGSNQSPTVGFQSLAVIKDAPRDGAWNEIKLCNNSVYRYMKYESPDGGCARKGAGNRYCPSCGGLAGEACSPVAADGPSGRTTRPRQTDCRSVGPAGPAPRLPTWGKAIYR